MKISIKNLKGELFTVDATGSETIAELKIKISATRPDLLPDRQKLIHAGKVLKDEQTVEELAITESDFIVCMVTKEAVKKPATVPVAAAAAPVSTPAPVPVTAATSSGAQATTSVSSSAAQQYSPEALQALIVMGFPEAESKAALIAAMGNPDLAYEFLLTGIPSSSNRRTTAPPPAATTGPAATTSTNNAQVGIQQLRQHPQFNMLKRLVQQNPAAMPQVLDLINQQSPALYTAIQADNEAFIAMMNEPITESAASEAPAAAMPSVSGAASVGGAGLDNMGQVVQFLSALPPAQRAEFAQTMGMSPQDLESLMTVMNSIPPEQFQHLLAGAGVGQGQGGAAGGNTRVVRLTEQEMAAVNRLEELGFTRQQAAEAYLACDKNEELAANFLLGGGFGEEDMQGGGSDTGGDDHDDDNMYS